MPWGIPLRERLRIIRWPQASKFGRIWPVKEGALRAASTKVGGGIRRGPPLVDSLMNGCGQAGEAQGIFNAQLFQFDLNRRAE